MTFSIGTTLIFLVYSIFWIQLPGMFIADYIIPRRFKIWTRLLGAYLLGSAFLSVCYYTQSLYLYDRFIVIIGPILSLLYIIKYFKNGRPSLLNADEKFSPVFIVLFIFIYVASTLGFQFQYLGALGGETTKVYHDHLFHTGNIVALSRNLIPGDIHVDGIRFYYHYFHELMFGMCKRVIPVDAFHLYVNGNSLASAWPLSLALMIIGERIRAKKNCSKFNYLFYCGGLLVSCICILPLNVVGGTQYISWLNYHIFTNGNAMGVAMAFSILIVDALVEVWYERFDLRLIFVFFFFTVGITGYKGSSGVLLVAIAWSVYIIESIITKKIKFNRIFYIIAITLGFFFCYLLVVNGPSTVAVNNRARTLSPHGTLMASRIGQVFEKLGLDYMQFPWVVIGVIVSAICIMGPCILPFACFTIGKFKTLIKEKVIGDIYDWFVIGSVMMGLIAFLFIEIPGTSQVYFVITNAGFIFYGAMKYCIENRQNWVSKIMRVFFCLGILFLVFDLGKYTYTDIQWHKEYQAPAGDKHDRVSKETMEAYLWIRDNTPETAKIAVDRFSEDIDSNNKNNRYKDDRSLFFYASAFTERQVFIEGYDYSNISEKQAQAQLSINEKFYSYNWEEADAAITMNDIDYIVVTDVGHPDYANNNWHLKPVFNNKDVIVYEYVADDSDIGSYK